jgi:NAD(P)-dependent dehydrogenase (short-subunit alcohol dehydrogenase family)
MTNPGAGLLRGQHAAVTGGGRGIGAAIASALAAEGAEVTLLGRTLEDLRQHADSLHRLFGGRVQAVRCDVSDAPDVRRAFAEAARDFGAVTILVNNAGQSDAAPFLETTLASWERMLSVNLTGSFLCTQQVLPAMIAAGAGRIVNIASTAGLKGYARIASYCASKHGVIGLTRALAAETAKNGITVNAVCPGYTDGTVMLQTAVGNVVRTTGRTVDEARAALAKQAPRGTLVTLEEVADAVRWLCSPAASAITGQAIAVAGGEVM